MTQRFKFVGDGPVDLPEFALVEVTRGTYVEVDDPERAKSMQSSPDWQHVPDKQRSRSAKKAAAKKRPAGKASEVKAPEASPDSVPVVPSENRDAEQEN